MTLQRLVDEALTCLELEHRAAHEAMLCSLDGRGIVLVVDHDRATLTGAYRGATPALRISCSGSSLKGVLGGSCDALDEILAGHLDIIGHIDDLIAAGHALRYFIEGGIRCPSMPRILERFDAMVEG